MKEPCRSCDEKEKDFGGCRCQALMLTGDAANTDPVCSKSPLHSKLVDDIRAIEENAKTILWRNPWFFVICDLLNRCFKQI